MESVSWLLSAPPPYASTSLRLYSPKLSTVAFSASFASVSSPQRKPPKPGKRSPKIIKTESPTTTTTTSDAATSSSASIPPKKVLVPIGFGTEEMEAVIMVDVLRRAGAQVTVASVEPQLEVEASGGTRLVADTSISTCSDQVFDLVALPGGMPGSVRLRECETLKQITSRQAEEKRLYGAICAAPAVTLLPWGLSRKKQITCHPAFMSKLPTFWAVKSNIQVSGELTTSRGPGTSFEFALSLVEQLFGESVASKIGESLLHKGWDNAHPKVYKFADTLEGMLHSADNRKEEFNNVEWSVNHTPQVLIPVANGSEESEVVTIADILRRAKVEVAVASVERSKHILASQGMRIVADKLIVDAADSIYDIIILPGGVAGAERLQKSRILKKLLREQNTAGRIYGAVCSSPAVLHKQGLLKGKRATAHPSVVSKLTNEVTNDAKVVIDGKLITSRGLGTVTDFAMAIVIKLFGQARARSVAEGLVFELPRS